MADIIEKKKRKLKKKNNDKTGTAEVWLVGCNNVCNCLIWGTVKGLLKRIEMDGPCKLPNFSLKIDSVPYVYSSMATSNSLHSIISAISTNDNTIFSIKVFHDRSFFLSLNSGYCALCDPNLDSYNFLRIKNPPVQLYVCPIQKISFFFIF